jgi:hypothetical protein
MVIRVFHEPSGPRIEDVNTLWSELFNSVTSRSLEGVFGPGTGPSVCQVRIFPWHRTGPRTARCGWSCYRSRFRCILDGWFFCNSVHLFSVLMNSFAGCSSSKRRRTARETQDICLNEDATANNPAQVRGQKLVAHSQYDLIHRFGGFFPIPTWGS